MSDNLAQRLAALGKPLVIDYPNENGDTMGPIVAAVNAARETGTAQLLFGVTTDTQLTGDDLNRIAENMPTIECLHRGLVALSLHTGELVAKTHPASFEGARQGATPIRIDVICTDHPTQRGRLGEKLTDAQQAEEAGRRG